MTRRPHQKSSAFTLIELLLVITIIAILVGMLLPALVGATDAANRMACGANLKAIGQAIANYAARYQGHYPTVYNYPNNPPNPNLASQQWQDDGDGYSDDPHKFHDSSSIPAGTQAANLGPFFCNISCLFLLVRSGDVGSENIFLCKADPNAENDQAVSPRNNWSFSYITNCSYSYQNQLPDIQGTGPAANLDGGSRNSCQATLDPSMIVAADANPNRYYSSGSVDPAINSALASLPGRWNSPNHKFRGQNCLYADGRVAFKDNPFCGYGGSNIWTRGTFTPPVFTVTTITTPAVWSNADLSANDSLFGPGYGGAQFCSATAGCGTGDKFNSWLVP